MVVLKRLRASHHQDPRYYRMLAAEARLLQELHHPNIVAAYDTTRVATEGYFTMEYVDGLTLFQLMAPLARCGATLPIDVAVSIIIEAAAGLHHAHELVSESGMPCNVIHRDVSMSNVLVGRDGSVKVADFGVAKARNNEIETDVNLIKGKLGYMSPEQCRGQRLDRRSDVFALGILLYETTTGRRLFTARKPWESLCEIRRCIIPLPSSVSPGYPAALEEIVMRALAADREGRYPSALALMHDLFSVRRVSSATAPAAISATVAAVDRHARLVRESA
jgi:serine/threonine-protein kinase